MQTAEELQWLPKTKELANKNNSKQLI